MKTPWFTILGFVVLGFVFVAADTDVPLRGTNTQAKGTFTIPGHQGTFAYRQVNQTQVNVPAEKPPTPPGLDDSSIGEYGSPRFKRIFPNTYLILVEPHVSLLTTNEPKIYRKKGGYWEIDLQ